jgi:hypothetical protein
MPLLIARTYGQDFPGLGQFVAHVLNRSAPAPKPLRMVGPIPVFTALHAHVARGTTRAIAHLGWRGLILDSAEAPVACVDIMDRAGQTPAYGIDGPTAARALHDALMAAEGFAATTPHRYRLRLLRLDSLLLSALWLQGRHSRFILTRDGPATPPRPTLLPRSRFVRWVKSRTAIANSIG